MLAAGAEVLSRCELPVESEADVVLVRRKVKQLAQKRGFDAIATAGVTTATSEVTRNVWMHAHGGTALIEEISEDGRLGLRVEFRDRGPGIADIARVLAGGYANAHSLGLGLSGSRRLVDALEVENEVGRGTTVRMVKWTRFSAPPEREREKGAGAEARHPPEVTAVTATLRVLPPAGAARGPT